MMVDGDELKFNLAEMFQKIKKKGLEEILKLQKKRIFVNERFIPGEVYVEAADLGYIAMKFPDGQIIFYKPVETVVECPQSQWQGWCIGQVPDDGRYEHGC